MYREPAAVREQPDAGKYGIPISKCRAREDQSILPAFRVTADPQPEARPEGEVSLEDAPKDVQDALCLLGNAMHRHKCRLSGGNAS